MSQLIGDRAATSVDSVSIYGDLRANSTRALSLRYDYLRTDVDVLGATVLEDHNSVRTTELSERTLERALSDVDALLTALAYDRGLSWSTIAELAGVSVSAVRKWRLGGAASADKRLALARIAALIDLLEDKAMVGDPATWLEMNLPVDQPGFNIRPIDLYMAGEDVALLEIAERRRPVAHVLDEAVPGWRASRSAYEVFDDADGSRSIRPRTT